uniref:Programmed cell death protein 6 (inferred by orthology to a human protein) n=1 Tax=Strongyloides venezuelensis TaxID=75913 RepID=A0A0K0F4U5_STRVS
MAYQQYHPPQGLNLRQIFDNVDRDRSGNISAEELQKALSNGTWSPFNPETCRLMIGMFDTNGDGGINFNEFQSLWRYIEDFTRVFRSFDTDNSGNIDKNELVNALTQFGYRLSNSFYDLLMTKFDRTNTKTVYFDDFIQLCVVLQTLTAGFRDKDTDRDGVITVGYEEFLRMVFSVKMDLMGRH